jgi:hypothetical protein
MQVLEIDPEDEDGHSQTRLLEAIPEADVGPPPTTGSGLILPASTLKTLDWSQMRFPRQAVSSASRPEPRPAERRNPTPGARAQSPVAAGGGGFNQMPVDDEDDGSDGISENMPFDMTPA